VLLKEVGHVKAARVFFAHCRERERKKMQAVAVGGDGGPPPDPGGCRPGATTSGREQSVPPSPSGYGDGESSGRQRAPDTADVSGGDGDLAAPLPPPPPPLPPPTIKSKKRKRKDASGPAGSPPDCRTLIYGAQVGARDRVRAACARRTLSSIPVSPPQSTPSKHTNQARASIELKPVRFIRLQDVQNLVLWVLGEGPNPAKWAFVRNKALVDRVVLVGLPGLDAQTWRAKRAGLPTLGGRLGEPVPVLAQRADVWPSQSVRALFSVPETKKAKAARSGTTRPPLPPPHPPSHYVLTADELRVCEFPLAGVEADGRAVPLEGYVATQPRADGADGSPAHQPLVALDCEMCETASGFELTRVSLVDGDGAILVDELVRPDAPIVEYHTRFSGITAAMLEGVTTRLADAQAAVLAHLSADTLLVGHGLENDLRALRIAHAAVIDTSVLYPHPRGLPSRTALRRLAATFLKKNIQGGEHDSVEDARVALELARLKFRHGPGWGVEAPDKGEKLCAVLAEAGRAASLVDRPDVINRHVAGERRSGDGLWEGMEGRGARTACGKKQVAPPPGAQPCLPLASRLTPHILVPTTLLHEMAHRAHQRAAVRDRQGGRGQGRARGGGTRRRVCVDPADGAGRLSPGPRRGAAWGGGGLGDSGGRHGRRGRR
jgi:DNA polymerase III epsilon subunit-like protein